MFYKILQDSIKTTKRNRLYSQLKHQRIGEKSSVDASSQQDQGNVTVLFGDSKIVDLILENAERKCIAVYSQLCLT